jgi:TetR/AcrR family tetracycline transcriptional repressor
LQRTAILSAALDLLDHAGLDGLTMRALASKLNVKAPSLYWHYPGKDALIADMTAAILSQVAIDLDPVLGCGPALRLIATDLRRALLAHRDGALLLRGALHTQDEGLRIAELIIGAATRAGYTPELAGRVSFVLLSYVQGYVLDEQALSAGTGHQLADVLHHLPLTTAGRYPAATAALADMVDEGPDTRFAVGVDLIIAGLARQARRDDSVERMVEVFRSVR